MLVVLSDSKPLITPATCQQQLEGSNREMKQALQTEIN